GPAGRRGLPEQAGTELAESGPKDRCQDGPLPPEFHPGAHERLRAPCDPCGAAGHGPRDHLLHWNGAQPPGGGGLGPGEAVKTEEPVPFGTGSCSHGGGTALTFRGKRGTVPPIKSNEREEYSPKLRRRERAVGASPGGGGGEGALELRR